MQRSTLHPRIALIAPGPPDARATQSGVPASILAALEARRVEVLPIDSSLSIVQRGTAAVEAFFTNPPASANPSAGASRKHALRSRMYRSRRGVVARSANATRPLLDPTSTPVDVLLVVRGVYRPFETPYAPYIDGTAELAEREWPAWLPWSKRELGRVYRQEQEYFAAASHIFVTSKHVADSLLRRYEVPVSQITVVGAGANMVMSERVSSLRDNAAPTVLFVGRDWYRKGGDVLLAAFKQVVRQVPGARLVVVGSVPPEAFPWLEVHPAVQTRAEMQKLYATATVFCLPTRFDGYGMSFLEAMAHALPCVGTDVCAVPDIIIHGVTGYVEPPEDHHGIATSLSRLLQDPNLSQALGAAGRQRVETALNWDRVVDVMLARLRH